MSCSKQKKETNNRVIQNRNIYFKMQNMKLYNCSLDSMKNKPLQCHIKIKRNIYVLYVIIYVMILVQGPW